MKSTETDYTEKDLQQDEEKKKNTELRIVTERKKIEEPNVIQEDAEETVYRV